jgi:hypothetical protein
MVSEDLFTSVDITKKNIPGLSLARVRLLFQLPNILGSTPHPLAYVDWYKPLDSQAIDPDMQMFVASLDRRRTGAHWAVRSSIIPVTDIQRTCHLIPQFGKRCSIDWTSAEVLDQAKKFYLNPYLRHRDFFLLRYLMRLHEKSRESEAAAIAETRRRNAFILGGDS